MLVSHRQACSRSPNPRHLVAAPPPLPRRRDVCRAVRGAMRMAGMAIRLSHPASESTGRGADGRHRRSGIRWSDTPIGSKRGSDGMGGQRVMPVTLLLLTPRLRPLRCAALCLPSAVRRDSCSSAGGDDCLLYRAHRSQGFLRVHAEHAARHDESSAHATLARAIRRAEHAAPARAHSIGVRGRRCRHGQGGAHTVGRVDQV